MFSRMYSRILLLLLCAVFFVYPYSGNANEAFYTSTVMTTATFRWNNENWFTEPHPRVAEFTVREDGSAYGTIETGVPFTQENIENALGLRIQRFVLQDHYHYIIDGREVYSLTDFSIALAQAYDTQTTSS